MTTGFKTTSGSAIPFIDKDPSANLVYGFDWTDWLAGLGGGVTITAATWTVPAGLTKVSEGAPGAITTVRLSGGTDGAKYLVTCSVTTSSGDSDERSMLINVKQR